MLPAKTWLGRGEVPLLGGKKGEWVLVRNFQSLPITQWEGGGKGKEKASERETFTLKHGVPHYANQNA